MISENINLGDDVQRRLVVIRETFVLFPVSVAHPIGTDVLLRGARINTRLQSLSHGDVLARLDSKIDPAGRRISIPDFLTGYWQVGVENQPRWQRVALVYYQLL